MPGVCCPQDNTRRITDRIPYSCCAVRDFFCKNLLRGLCFVKDGTARIHKIMPRLKLLLLVFILNVHAVLAQNISGIVINAEDKQPVDFVNIGIAGKNVGTVTDVNGCFHLSVDPCFSCDSLLFSRIGYNSCSIKIADLMIDSIMVVPLKEKTYELSELKITPRKFKTRTLGVTTKFKKMNAGFEHNLLGYECGILMKVKKSALIKKVNIHIATCTYDTILYRLNIYKVQGKRTFVNMLKEPVYITMPGSAVKDEIQLDLQSKNIVVDGNFLITLEHVKDLGEGLLYFCAGFGEKTYFRKTSQGKWETVPIGISISVLADVEK